jgi:hypothetical protein
MQEQVLSPLCGALAVGIEIAGIRAASAPLDGAEM